MIDEDGAFDLGFNHGFEDRPYQNPFSRDHEYVLFMAYEKGYNEGEAVGLAEEEDPYFEEFYD